MTQIAEQYGKVLYELQISREDVEFMRKTLETVPELIKILDNPVLSKKQKHTVVEKVFPKNVHNFLKTVSDHRRMGQIGEILDGWSSCVRQEENLLAATLFCVHEPDQTQKAQIENFVRERFGKTGVELTVKYQPDLIGGFVLQVGDREFDWSLKGRIRQLQQRLIRR